MVKIAGGRPDYVSISGAKVVTSFVVEDEDFNKLTEQKNNPEKMLADNVPGMTGVKVKWIVSSGSNYSITVDSAKGGKASWGEREIETQWLVFSRMTIYLETKKRGRNAPLFLV